MLKMSSVRRSFGRIVAVDNLSLEVRSGEIFGLLGPNGAGKSTTIHMAVGLLEPDRGAVAVAGLGSPRAPGVRARIGIAPQQLSLYGPLSGAENLAFFGRMYGLTGRRLTERIQASLEFVGLTDRMLIAALGTTEQAAAGAGWAVMLPLTMLGGGMVPLFVMPAWMSAASNFSPAKWAVLAMEGGIWRGFSAAEMLLPCTILITTGLVCFALGSRTFRPAA